MCIRYKNMCCDVKRGDEVQLDLRDYSKWAQSNGYRF